MVLRGSSFASGCLHGEFLLTTHVSPPSLDPKPYPFAFGGQWVGLDRRHLFLFDPRVRHGVGAPPPGALAFSFYLRWEHIACAWAARARERERKAAR